MLKVVISKIKPGKEPRLRAWLEELMTRRHEVVETFRQEGVRHEQAFILEGSEGPLLLYVIEAGDHEQARMAFIASTLQIDAEHRRVMAEVLDGRVELAPVYDCEDDGSSRADNP